MTKLFLHLVGLVAFSSLASSQCVIPTPPPNIVCTPLSPYTVRFQVNPATAPTIGYQGQREPEGGVFATVNMGYPGGVFIDNSKLIPGQTFCYRSQALTPCGTSYLYSDYTTEVMVTMPDGPMPYMGAPEPPYNLGATFVSGHVLLTWTLGAFPAVLGQTQDIQIERSRDGITFGLLNIAGNNRTSLADYNIVSGTTYYYRARAFNDFGWSTGSYGNCGVNNQTCGTAWSNMALIFVP